MNSIFFNLKSITLIILLTASFSCNIEFNSIGYELLSSKEIVSKKFTAPVFSINQEISDVQSNQLPYLHLGEYHHSLFGRSSAQIISQLSISNNPVFGVNSQLIEDSESDDVSIIQENEEILDVFLEIPFFVNNDDSDNDGVTDEFDVDPQNRESDSDGDGVLDYIETQNSTNPLNIDTDGDGINDLEDENNSVEFPKENNEYRIDSIYGNKFSQFKLKVNELTYYLNSFDINNNFETMAGYFSSQDLYKEGFVGAKLYDDLTTLNFDELRFYYKKDDSITLDIDETKVIETRLTPRIRIPLDKSFFQNKILDKEGSFELSNQSDFSEYLRGIIITFEDSSDNLYMLLNFNSASIKIDYQFDRYNAAENFIYKDEKTFSIGTLGMSFNNFNNTNSKLINSDNGTRIFLKGGLGIRSKLKLFQDSPEKGHILDSIRNEQWLINEANLVFYVDQDEVNKWKNEEISDRLFVYNISNKNVLVDYYSDPSKNTDLVNRNRYIHGGILEYDENQKPYRYKIRVTEHVRNLLLNKDLENADLGLVVTSDIDNYFLNKAIKDGSDKIIFFPRASIMNPMGTVLIGPNPSDKEKNKKPILEIYYTDFSLN